MLKFLQIDGYFILDSREFQKYISTLEVRELSALRLNKSMITKRVLWVLGVALCAYQACEFQCGLCVCMFGLQSQLI
jgi:hypothetical protein